MRTTSIMKSTSKMKMISKMNMISKMKTTSKLIHDNLYIVKAYNALWASKRKSNKNWQHGQDLH